MPKLSSFPASSSKWAFNALFFLFFLPTSQPWIGSLRCAFARGNGGLCQAFI